MGSEMSDRYAADLLVLQVVPPEHLTGPDADSAAQAAADQLAALTRDICGDRGRPLVVYDSDPADAIVRTCEDERVDLVVVGNSACVTAPSSCSAAFPTGFPITPGARS